MQRIARFFGAGYTGAGTDGPEGAMWDIVASERMARQPALAALLHAVAAGLPQASFARKVPAILVAPEVARRILAAAASKLLPIPAQGVRRRDGDAATGGPR